MLSIKRQQKYLNKKLGELTLQLENYKNSSNQDNLHAMRIAIKKYRAMVFVVMEISGHKKLKSNIKPMKTFFRMAGEIRTVFVHQKILNTHNINNKFLNKKLKKELNEKESVFMKNAPSVYKSIVKADKKIVKLLPEFKNDQILRYIDKCLNLLRDCLEKAEDFHECRKKLKRLMYLKEIFSTKAIVKTQLNFNYIDKLQDAIGHWHDMLMLKDFLLDNIEVSNDLIKKIEENLVSSEDDVNELKNDFVLKVKES